MDLIEHDSLRSGRTKELYKKERETMTDYYNIITQ